MTETFWWRRNKNSKTTWFDAGCDEAAETVGQGGEREGEYKIVAEGLWIRW